MVLKGCCEQKAKLLLLLEDPEQRWYREHCLALLQLLFICICTARLIRNITKYLKTTAVIFNCCIFHFLQLNSSKTEALLVGTPHQVQSSSITHLKISRAHV